MDNIEITVTIPNGKGDSRKLTFVAPSDATVDIWSAYSLIGNTRELVEVNINLQDNDIKVEESNG